MKKLFLTVVLAAVSLGAFAQVEYGVKAGLNLANLTNDWEGKFKPSVHVGVFADFHINSLFSVQPELIYSRQGSFDKAGDVKTWLRLNYLNLPVLLKLNITEKFSFNAGPQFGVMLNSTAKAKMSGTTIKSDVNDDLKSFDVSFALGASYKITNRIDVYGRYNVGMTKVIENCRNSVIQFGVGYRF